MKKGSQTYIYKKQKGGRGRFGMVEIELNSIKTNSRVVDNCEWNIMKESYPNFKEIKILKIWKQSALDAAKSAIEAGIIPQQTEIKINDLSGLYVDTVPSHIGVAALIGIFDCIDSPLNENEIEIIDRFVLKNSDPELIPEYKKLAITLYNKT